MDEWVFGYGSLIWKPDLPFLEQRPVRACGWVRRFWQGSHDHRGAPHAPGRVVTLIEQADGYCDGVAYRIAGRELPRIFQSLDDREKNGYARHYLQLVPVDGEPFAGVVYIATPKNEAFLGPAPLDDMARHILASRGPSGSNRDYLYELAAALRRLQFDDTHVFALERAVRTLEERG
ncbi:MAG: gamma-glutamylcyclotransferase [Gammaproteobacteria bacterium]|nr:gamma-glutamylcyclotransferase [Gammaproteobacteria bacterium]